MPILADNTAGVNLAKQTRRPKRVQSTPIDTLDQCTLPMAAVRLGLPIPEAEHFLRTHGVPRRCLWFRKAQSEWTAEEAEEFEYAVKYLGEQEGDYPRYEVLFYSGRAVRQLCFMISNRELFEQPELSFKAENGGAK